MIGINSKFKILPIFLACYLTIVPLLCIYYSFKSRNAGVFLPILLLLFVASFWLTIFRTRAHSVKIDKREIIVKRYFGLGFSEIYNFDKADGFITLFESGKLGLSESIFILEKGRRVVCISSFYHRNFYDLKMNLKDNLADLGRIKSNFKNESTELFK